MPLDQPASVEERDALGELVDLAAHIARRGYGESVVCLALCRKGVPDDVARLVAASVTSCHASIAAAERHVAPEGIAAPPASLQATTPANDLRSARTASKALYWMASFLVFVVIGICGGAFLGWSIGFDQGMEQGLDQVITALEQALAR